MSLKRWFSRSISDGPEMVGPLAPPSPRSVKRKMMLITLAGTLALVGAVSGAYYFAMRPVTLRIAVGPQNSDDLKLVQTLTQSFAHSPVRLRALQTDGAVASAAALAEGKADLAVIRGDLTVPKNAQAVATLRKNVVVLWAPPPPKAEKGKKAAPKITKIQQLAGKRIVVVGRTDANVNLLKLILRQYGLDAGKVEIVQFPASEAADAIKNQKADAYLAAGPVNSKITTDAINASIREGASPTFIAVDAAAAISQNFPAYEAAEIPAGAFGGSPARPEEDVKTLSFSHHFVARKGLSEATVAAFTRQLFSVRQALLTEFPLAAKIETPDTDKDAVIPAHPGAAAYVDGEEKSFLDRYSDYIWFGLMGLSLLGSVGAWFASFLKKDERSNNASARERLLDMLMAARQSESPDELDRMQAEADAILRETLTGFEQGAFDLGSLAAFHIALEQFHNAVADRKILLASLPQHLQRTGLQLRSTGNL